MNINQFLSGKPVVFEGFLVKRTEKLVTLQIHPGLTIDVAASACKEIEEAADTVSGKTYLRLTLEAGADIHATFQPRLARLALKQGATGVPFGMGGLPQGVEKGPVFLTRSNTGGGGVGGGGYTYNTPTSGEFATRSYVFFWGWCDDDTTYSDRSEDGVIE